MQNSEQSSLEFSTYPPAVLLVNENSPSILELKRSLEKKQCRVYQTDSNDNLWTATRLKDFELVVLNAESLDEDVYESFQQLQNRCKSSDVPIVILTMGNIDTEKIAKLKSKCPIYYLPVDEPFTEATLWQLITWKHYLTYRYN